ncbi:MAG: peptidase [Bacteroidota bacterium]
MDNYPGTFICECGTASDLSVKDCQQAEAIFISHTHIDHFINFDFLLRHQIGLQRRIVICGPEGITQQVQSKIRGYQWNLIEADAITYEIREIKNDRSIERSELRPPLWDVNPIEDNLLDGLYRNKRMAVDFTILDHKTPSIAYLFREQDTVKIDMSKSEFKGGSWVRTLKTAFENGEDDLIIGVENQEFTAKELYHLLEVKEGDTLGVVMDHAASKINHEKIEVLFQSCNKVFIECFYKEEDKAFAEANFHSYSKESARIIRKCQVNEAIPVHFSRKYSEEQVEELLDEFYGELK